MASSAAAHRLRLHTAVRRGDEAAVAAILAEAAASTSSSPSPSSPSAGAAPATDTATGVLRQLLRERNQSGGSALHLAARLPGVRGGRLCALLLEAWDQACAAPSASSSSSSSSSHDSSSSSSSSSSHDSSSHPPPAAAEAGGTGELRRRGDTELLDARDSYGWTALMMAVDALGEALGKGEEAAAPSAASPASSSSTSSSSASVPAAATASDSASASASAATDSPPVSALTVLAARGPALRPRSVFRENVFAVAAAADESSRGGSHSGDQSGGSGGGSSSSSNDRRRTDSSRTPVSDALRAALQLPADGSGDPQFDYSAEDAAEDAVVGGGDGSAGVGGVAAAARELGDAIAARTDAMRAARLGTTDAAAAVVLVHPAAPAADGGEYGVVVDDDDDVAASPSAARTAATTPRPEDDSPLLSVGDKARRVSSEDSRAALRRPSHASVSTAPSSGVASTSARSSGELDDVDDSSANASRVAGPHHRQVRPVSRSAGGSGGLDSELLESSEVSPRPPARRGDHDDDDDDDDDRAPRSGAVAPDAHHPDGTVSFGQRVPLPSASASAASFGGGSGSRSSDSLDLANTASTPVASSAAVASAAADEDVSPRSAASSSSMSSSGLDQVTAMMALLSQNTSLVAGDVVAREHLARATERVLDLTRAAQARVAAEALLRPQSRAVSQQQQRLDRGRRAGAAAAAAAAAAPGTAAAALAEDEVEDPSSSSAAAAAMVAAVAARDAAVAARAAEEALADAAAARAVMQTRSNGSGTLSVASAVGSLDGVVLSFEVDRALPAEEVYGPIGLAGRSYTASSSRRDSISSASGDPSLVPSVLVTGDGNAGGAHAALALEHHHHSNRHQHPAAAAAAQHHYPHHHHHQPQHGGAATGPGSYASSSDARPHTRRRRHTGGAGGGVGVGGAAGVGAGSSASRRVNFGGVSSPFGSLGGATVGGHHGTSHDDAGLSLGGVGRLGEDDDDDDVDDLDDAQRQQHQRLLQQQQQQQHQHQHHHLSSGGGGGGGGMLLHAMSGVGGVASAPSTASGTPRRVGSGSDTADLFQFDGDAHPPAPVVVTTGGPVGADASAAASGSVPGVSVVGGVSVVDTGASVAQDAAFASIDAAEEVRIDSMLAALDEAVANGTVSHLVPTAECALWRAAAAAAAADPDPAIDASGSDRDHFLDYEPVPRDGGPFE